MIRIKAEALTIFALSMLCPSVCIALHGTALHVLITEICPDPYGSDECEYVALTNPLPYAVRLEGWQLCDLHSTVKLPEIALQPSQTVYLVKNVSTLDVTALKTSLGAVTLNNDGDAISLLDDKGRLIDTVAYGTVPSDIRGWSGEPLRTQEGIVLRRKSGNEGWKDSDSWKDWFPVAFEHRDRTAFNVKTFSFFGCVTAFVSPDCSFEVVSSEIENCSNVVFLNVYEFESFPLAELLVRAIERNVTVKVLLEGSPVGGLSDDTLTIARIIKGSGGEVRLARSRPKMFNHAKYAVLDGGVLVLSENWKGVSMPVRETLGGNRGWGVIIRDENVSSYFKELFLEDFRFNEPFSGDAVSVGIDEGNVNYHLLKPVACSPQCAFTAHLAAFTHAPRAWSGSCERPQPNAHTEPPSSPSERRLHTEDMKLVDRDPCNRYAPIIYVLPQFPHKLKLVAPLRKNDVEKGVEGRGELLLTYARGFVGSLQVAACLIPTGWLTQPLLVILTAHGLLSTAYGRSSLNGCYVVIPYNFKFKLNYPPVSPVSPRSRMESCKQQKDKFEARTISGNFEVRTFVAPENILCDDPILEMINSARRRVYVEMFSVQNEFYSELNPYVAALLAAARRGCEVKVLFDSRDYNLERGDDNDDVLAFLNEVATAEGLKLEARLADLKALGFSKIHNKGIIADDSVLISSFNWNEGALDNREVGVVVTNAELASYFAEVFLYDWNASGGSVKKVSSNKTKTVVGTAVALVSAYIIFLVVRRLRYGW